MSEWTLQHADGRFVPVEVSAKILPDGRWQAFVRDISERRHAEEALRRSEESLNRAQRVAHVGSWDWDLVTDEITRSAERHPERGLVPLRVSAAPIDHAPPASSRPSSPSKTSPR